MTESPMKDERLSYDEIVELVVDSDDKIQPWSLRQEAKIAVALRELRQRREDERVSETLAGAAKHLPAPLSSNLVSRLRAAPPFDQNNRKPGDSVYQLCSAAADEIERLARERDQATVLVGELAALIPISETSEHLHWCAIRIGKGCNCHAEAIENRLAEETLPVKTACDDCLAERRELLSKVALLRSVVDTTRFHLARGDHDVHGCVDQIIDAHEKVLRETAEKANAATIPITERCSTYNRRGDDCLLKRGHLGKCNYPDPGPAAEDHDFPSTQAGVIRDNGDAP